MLEMWRRHTKLDSQSLAPASTQGEGLCCEAAGQQTYEKLNTLSKLGLPPVIGDFCKERQLPIMTWAQYESKI